MPERTSAAPEGYTTVAPWVVTDDTARSGTARSGSATSWPSTGARTGLSCLACCGRSSRTRTRRSPGRSRPAPGSSRPWRTAPSGSGGRIKDPCGNIWWVAAQVEDVAEEERWKRLRMPVHAQVMKMAQETFDAEMAGRGSGRSGARSGRTELRSRPTPPAWRTGAGEWVQRRTGQDGRLRPARPHRPGRTAPDPAARPPPNCPTAPASHRGATANRRPRPSAHWASPTA
ncbi:hypothetical protein QFZ32_006610 [Streptomyces canus]|nr:hypothetical protein [Streptomyces canus]